MDASIAKQANIQASIHTHVHNEVTPGRSGSPRKLALQWQHK